MNDDDLRGRLDDAVADVEPADRLAEIRARVAGPPRRSWRYAVGGAVLATAATVAAVAVLTGDDPVSPPVVAPSGSTSPPASPPATDAPTPVAVYYVGDTPRGPRLFREWRPPDPDGPSPLLTTLTSTPVDPDYRTLWPAGSLRTASDPEAGVVHVTLADGSLAERPAEMSEEEARLAVQQVVYTVRADHPGEQLVVRFRLETDGEPLETTVLGLPADEFAAAPPLDVLSHVNLSDPAEGRVVSGTFTARGVASSPEATVPWQLLRGDEVVLDGFATAEGWLDRLYPWETEVDVSGLEPGTYTLVARTADDSGGEGPGPDVDTRTVVVE